LDASHTAIGSWAASPLQRKWRRSRPAWPGSDGLPEVDFVAGIDVSAETSGVGQERSYSVLPEIGRWPTKSVRAARGDILPSRNIHRRIVNGVTDRCCSHINELHGTQSAYIARTCLDAGTCIGRAANNCPDLITVMRPQKEDATQASNRQILTIIEKERNRPN
jgi:hypothetical protein